MASVCRRVRFTEDRVRVQLRPSVLDRDVADERKDLDLLVDRNVDVPLGGPVEVRHHGARERADRGEVARAEPLFRRERRQHLHRLVARRENQDERAHAAALVEERALHDHRRWRGASGARPRASRTVSRRSASSSN